MTKSKLIILAWLLLLVPTLLLGVGAARLLKGEDARLASAGQAAARDRCEAIAGNIDLAIGEVKDGLLETLRALPQQNLTGQLLDWKRQNPLVRNVFIWRQGSGLLLPDPQRPASDEEAAFIRRYLSLFANQTTWQEPSPERAAADKIAPAADVSSVFSERRQLRQLAKQAPAPKVLAESAAPEAGDRVAAAPAPTAPAKVAPPPGQSDWRSWYADDQLHLLGWFAPNGSNLRYGVEVEMAALLSRLFGNLSPQPGETETFALIDGNGRVVHQSGRIEISRHTTSLASVTIPALPHWQVAAYADPGTTSSRSGVLLIGSLLVAIFTAAILLGGSLLLWQAWRHQREARQKTGFVSNVSHELKTPLTTIRMYAELLGEGKIPDPAKQQRYLETIIRESRRLTRLVNNVLDFSRLEQGRRRFQPEPTEMLPLLTEILESQGPRLQEAGLQLELQLPNCAPIVAGERDALQQILINLLDNAIKYAASGERLQLSVEVMADSLIMKLRDFGPGIPPSHRKRIFDKFHRVDATLTSERQGTGLGLSIARQLAEGLGGRLAYTPAEGGGSCFELTLPLMEA